MSFIDFPIGPNLGAPAQAAASGLPVWTPDLIPEFIVSSWYQEDLQPGAVASWPSRGVIPCTMTQATGGLQPTKVGSGRAQGVQFAEGAAQALSASGNQLLNAFIDVRWWLAIASCDISNNSGVASVYVMDINRAGTQYEQPRVQFLPATAGGSVRSIWRDRNSSATVTAPVNSKLQQWNCILGYRRSWSLGLIVNGVKATPSSTLGSYISTSGAPCYFGAADGNPLGATVAIDCIILGAGELSDAELDKVMGWAMWRAGSEKTLPRSHAYYSAPPQGLDTNDYPDQYQYDDSDWGFVSSTPAGDTSSNQAGTPVSTAAYSPVFFEDFTGGLAAIVDDASGTQGSSFFAPSAFPYLGGTGVTLVRPGGSPTTYAVNDSTSVSITLQSSAGVWYTGVLSSVNSSGAGRSWAGGGIFEMKYKFTGFSGASIENNLNGTFFSYARGNLLSPRTRNRLEFDFSELSGGSLNTTGTTPNTTQHLHVQPIAYPAPNQAQSEQFFKLCNTQMSVANGWSPLINMFDGNYHIMYTQIEANWTYIVVDGIEVARYPTPREALEPLFWLATLWIQGTSTGLTGPYRMIIDYIRVRQLETVLEQIPAAFSALPTLTGTLTHGNVLTCTPNVVAGQIEYEWYWGDTGAPIAGATSSTYTLQTGDVGHTIRVNVKAISLVNQPNAWTLISGTVS